MMTAALFDYGTGNLHSLRKAIESAGVRVHVASDAVTAVQADALVLPGVGAFGPAAARLTACGEPLRAAIRGGMPTLGICLGMQLLFDESDEGDGRGLGIIQGRVRRLRARRLPQMGWNAVSHDDDPLFTGAAPLTAYYANSYIAEPRSRDSVVAWSQYGTERFAAAVRSGSAVGVQFHPEKSGSDGLRLIANFFADARR
jgi:imidazole glycerol-phosphate synthase subunit HisH